MKKIKTMIPVLSACFLSAMGSAHNLWAEQNVAKSEQMPFGNILFISNHDGDHEIYLTQQLGAKPVRLTSNERDDVGISWSGDGKKILFSSMRDGNSEIYLMDADGSNQQNLTQHDGLDISPSWSPDGTKILFVSNRDGKEDIFLLHLATGRLNKITQSTSGAFLPSWSPDGQRIAYLLRNEGNKSAHLVLTDGDGNHPVKLSTHKKTIDLHYSWSPDSRSILVASKRKKHINIFKMDIQGGDWLQLTDTQAADIMPQFSPDGSKILFLSQRENGIRQELFTMNADGSNPQKLINSRNMEYMNPSWSPDGKWISFSRYENRHFVAYAYSLEQNKMVKLSDDSGFQFHPTYAPEPNQTALHQSKNSPATPKI